MKGKDLGKIVALIVLTKQKLHAIHVIIRASYINENYELAIRNLYQFLSSLVLQNGLRGTFRSFNPLTPMSDQDRISPYNINTISTR